MQDIDFDRGHWAVVTAVGGKKYIGCFNMELEDVLKSIEENRPMVLYQAFEFINATMPVQGPRGEVGMQRISQCAPPNNCIMPDQLWVRVGDAQFFGDMEPQNLERHKGLVEQAMAQSMQARLQSSNIVIPKVGLPPGIAGGRLPT